MKQERYFFVMYIILYHLLTYPRFHFISDQRHDISPLTFFRTLGFNCFNPRYFRSSYTLFTVVMTDLLCFPLSLTIIFIQCRVISSALSVSCRILTSNDTSKDHLHIRLSVTLRILSSFTLVVTITQHIWFKNLLIKPNLERLL